MRCDQAQRTISDAMDGDVSAVRTTAAERHAAGCPRCASFADAAQRVRTAVRVRPAEPVPDLVGPIMAAVAAEARPADVATRRRPHRGPDTWRWIAAAVVGLLVGSLLVGGPASDGGDVALASVLRQVREAAPSVTAFDASYVITERGLHPSVPERSLRMRIAFLAPQRFRLEVADDTVYPSPDWTPTDVRYIEDMPATFLSGPTGCPADLGDVCPPTRVSVSRSNTVSAAAPLPQDLIVPVATFGSATGIQMIGDEQVGDRSTVHLRMSFERAAPLFPFLRLGGTWRPYFSGDVVDVWLDAEGWFPVAWTVSPSPKRGRAAWELRFGRAPEPAGSPIMQVRLTSVGSAAPPASSFAVPALSKWVATGNAPVADALGFEPTLPADTRGLELVSAVGPGPGETARRGVVVFGRGLEYLRVVEDHGWDGGGPFGPFGDLASWVELDGVGPVLYEPATAELGRRVAVHAAHTDLYLESNLPREDLLAIASTLRLAAGLPAGWLRAEGPSGSLEQLSVTDGLARAGLGGLAGVELPGGYVVSGARVERGAGASTVTVILRQPASDLAGPPLVLVSSPAGVTADPAGRPVDLGAVAGVLTPGGAGLAWRDAGWVRVLQGAGPADLTRLAAAVVGA
jgi:hypothetical protein